ncbi:MAG: methyltransferase, partial [Desulfovibrio piger]
LIDVCYLDVSRPGKDERFPEGFDRIVASELLYLDDLHRPLLKFVDRHLAPGGKAVFCTDMARAKPHFAKLAAKTFQVQEGHIGVKSQDADGKEQRRIYVLHILERKQ